jgi:hypothetical protein
MTIRIACLAAIIAALAANAAQAQGNDAGYCNALAAKYETYLNNMTSGKSPQQDSVDGRVALEQCKKGDTTAAIPVLEQKLRNAKIDLPPRG